MNTLAHAGFSDEQPTRKTERVSEALLIFASKIDRIAAVALERLSVDPDSDAVAAAIDDLTQLRELAGQVLR